MNFPYALKGKKSYEKKSYEWEVTRKQHHLKGK